MKIFFFDLETTGLLYWKHGIHQISGMVDIDGEVKESFNFNVQPYPTAAIDPDALKVANKTAEEIQAYPAIQKVYQNIIEMLAKYVDRFNKQDKFFLCGYNNASFDNAFFRAFFVQNFDNYFGSYFWSSSLDVMVLATHYLLKKRKAMLDFKLKTVAVQMGIEVDESKLHDATYDIELTREMYYIITNNGKL